MEGTFFLWIQVTQKMLEASFTGGNIFRVSDLVTAPRSISSMILPE
jgi:hypothetical protein